MEDTYHFPYKNRKSAKQLPHKRARNAKLASTPIQRISVVNKLAVNKRKMQSISSTSLEEIWKTHPRSGGGNAGTGPCSATGYMCAMEHATDLSGPQFTHLQNQGAGNTSSEVSSNSDTVGFLLSYKKKVTSD